MDQHTNNNTSTTNGRIERHVIRVSLRDHLYNRFRRYYPEHGDVSRVVRKLIELHITELEKVHVPGKLH